MSMSPADNILPAALLPILQHLALCHDLPSILDIIRSETRRLIGSDGVTVILRRGDRCHYVEENAIGSLWKGQHFPMEACISGWVMLHRTPAVIEDIYADARVPHAAYEPTFVKSLAVVPIRRDQPIGAIGCYWATQHRCSDTELGILQTLADSTAIAMTNVHLITELTLAKQHAERDVELRDQFLALVAHELRTPLTTILGSAELLQRGLHHIQVPAKLQARSAVMLEEIQRLQDLTEKLLVFTEVQAGTLSLTRERVDLCGLLRTLVELHTRALSTHQVMMDLPETPCWVCADRGYLELALRNVLENAMQYSPKGGVIQIRLYPNNELVHLQIQDSGLGIPEDDLPHIFERFYRARNVNPLQLAGIGIGLAFVKAIVDLHGGHIAVKSQEGHGSTFTLTFPTIDERA